MYKIIAPLADPASYGGNPDDAFDVIVPSLPGYGLNDSPVGLASWIVEKFSTWSDGEIESVFTKDELLTNIMIYWLTQTINSSIRLYYETAHLPDQLSIIGFDDIEQAAESVPALTTIRQPIPLMAQEAVSMLRTLTGGLLYDVDQDRRIVQPELIVRASCSAALP